MAVLRSVRNFVVALVATVALGGGNAFAETPAVRRLSAVIGHSPIRPGSVATVLARLYPHQILLGDSVRCSAVARDPLEAFTDAHDSVFVIALDKDGTPRLTKIEVIDQRLPNAVAIAADPEFATSDRIRISTALLDRLPNEAALAFIIAHEMSHLQSGKIPTPLDGILLSSRQIARIAETHQRWEAEADAEATRVIFAAGYATTSGGDVLATLRGFDAASGALFRSHPKIELRIEALARLTATTS